MAHPVRLLLVSGSLRAMSTNTAVIRTAMAVAPDDVVATHYDGLDRLPHFNPDDDTAPLPPAVEALRRAIRGADAWLLSAGAHIVEPAGTHVAVTGSMVGTAGLIADVAVRETIAATVVALTEHVQQRLAAQA